MGYTHYWSELKVQEYPDELISVFNQAYQDFLRSGVTIDGKHINLFSVFMNKDEDEETFNQHFHEWMQGASGEPILFSDAINSWTFCKTARKSYDFAVVLTLFLVSVVLNKDYSSDGQRVTSLVHLQDYIDNELDDSFEYNLEQLISIFDIWLNRSIAFQDEIDKVESMKQYNRVSDLPDSELEYIGEQIKKGNTTIYLNNGQVVCISFE